MTTAKSAPGTSASTATDQARTAGDRALALGRGTRPTNRRAAGRSQTSPTPACATTRSPSASTSPSPRSANAPKRPASSRADGRASWSRDLASGPAEQRWTQTDDPEIGAHWSLVLLGAGLVAVDRRLGAARPRRSGRRRAALLGGERPGRSPARRSRHRRRRLATLRGHPRRARRRRRRRTADDPVLRDSSTAASRAADSIEHAGTILRGGAWIGALERLAVFAGLATGFPEGVAVVLALKGVGRFPDCGGGSGGDHRTLHHRHLQQRALGRRAAPAWSRSTHAR